MNTRDRVKLLERWDVLADKLSGKNRRAVARKIVDRKRTVDGFVDALLEAFDAGHHRGASNPYC